MKLTLSNRDFDAGSVWLRWGYTADTIEVETNAGIKTATWKNGKYLLII